MYTTKEILSTIDMIKNQCLDIRTITMGISLKGLHRQMTQKKNRAQDKR